MNTTSALAATAPLTIGAAGIDVDAIVADIQAAVDRKIADGTFADAAIARAERTNLINLREGEDFVTFYLTCLRHSVFVDISDFEIREQRHFLAKPLIALKKTIWKLLKFYTYRLWSQQNQVNGLLMTATEAVEDKSSRQIAALEARIAELEKRLGIEQPSAKDTDAVDKSHG